MSEALYIEPNRKARNFMWFTVILFAGLGLLLYLGLDYLTPAEDSTLEEEEASFIFLFKLEIGVLLIFFILETIWAIYFGYLGYRTFKLKSFPPTGLIVVFRTQIRTGKQAIKAGYHSIAYALFISIHVLSTCYMLSILHSQLLDSEKNKSETISPNIVNSTAAIKWVTLRKDSDDLFAAYDLFASYVAPEIIRISDNKVQMWSLSDYETSNPYYDSNSSFLSVKKFKEYNCKEEESRLLYSAYHTKNMGKGEITESRNKSGHWMSVKPKVLLRAEWNYACGK